jgi:hypothetical protein
MECIHGQSLNLCTMKSGNDVSSGSSFGHDDPVFAKESNQSMKPTAPLGSNFQRVCHDTLDFIQVPGFPSAILAFALTHSRRNVVQRLPWLISFSLDE